MILTKKNANDDEGDDVQWYNLLIDIAYKRSNVSSQRRRTLETSNPLSHIEGIEAEDTW